MGDDNLPGGGPINQEYSSPGFLTAKTLMIESP